jgi:hypothetical protein
MNAKYFISVGEPWDFESPDGQNIIRGFVLKIISATCLIFKANYLLNIGGVKGDVLVLTPRDLDGSFYELKNDFDYLTVNGGLLLVEYDENYNEKIVKDNSKFIIVGGVRKEN